ncbi:methyltransferase domain-containing protein [Amylibacter sp.]|nr:methyltransferase domain-containing protein [Rhodobacterales bacterium]MDA8894609.1 methyltransferase domain-containing protein [Amylibacter sp.]MDA9368970.1 methyltransferase domain-containing protein [bacterium]MDA9088511.1 methyltransferase domain-containing protein [Amylibacter sp.]MDA9788062.1 methyltransferase domain-containing protein [Amylibacter sp.]
MDTETIKYYDKSAESYLDKVCNTYPDSDLLSFINSIKSGGTVLDLGCGPGNSSAMMQTAGLNVQASDCSQKMVDIAKNKFNVDAIKAEFKELSEINLYDGVWANFSLLHAPRSEMLSNLKKINRSLKKKGYLHIGLKIGNGEKRDTLGRQYTYYQPKELKSLLISAGFTINTIRLDMDGAISMTGMIEPFMIVTAYA